jgi:hypothetical protein
MTVKDALGLTLVEDEPFDQPPSVYIYGSPGIGKSTSVAQAAQNALFILSSRNILAPYGSWMKMMLKNDETRAEALTYRPFASEHSAMPRLARYDLSRDAAEARGLRTLDFLDGLLTKIENEAAKGNRPYKGIVLDEMTDFSTRIYTEMQDDPANKKGGKVNGWAVVDAIKAFHKKLAKFPERTGMYLVMVCHAREPTYFDPTDSKVASDKRGTLKYKGGPAFAIGSLIEPLSADADFVFQLIPEAEGGRTKRFLLSELDEFWTRKARDFRIPHRVELSEAVLRKLMGEIDLTF